MNDTFPPRIESMVFDFDGTLAELRLNFGEMKSRIAELAREYVRTAPPDTRIPVLEWIETLAEDLASRDRGSAEVLRRRCLALIEEMELEAARGGCLFDFTRGVLDTLRMKRIRVAVITRNCEKAVRMVFPDLEEHCSALLTREHVPRVKPDPDHLLRALRKIGGAAGTALMIGDHPLDIQTGHRAGVLTAGVSSGNTTREELMRSGARWTAPDCRELMAVLEGLGLI